MIVLFRRFKIVTWRTQGVTQYNNAAYSKHPEEGEAPSNRNNKITNNRCVKSIHDSCNGVVSADKQLI